MVWLTSEIKLKRTDTTLDLSQKAKRAEERGRSPRAREIISSSWTWRASGTRDFWLPVGTSPGVREGRGRGVVCGWAVNGDGDLAVCTVCVRHNVVTVASTTKFQR